MTEREVFLAALEIKDPEGRERFLEEQYSENEVARGRVAELLQAADKVGSFLEVPAPRDEATAAFTAPTDLTGTIVAGKYKLREKLGEGGMGSVWVADQMEPVQRRVALKLIKINGDSRSMLARFEQERQALALMDHPNIAKVFDAGVDGVPDEKPLTHKNKPLTPSPSPQGGEGRTRQPYFVMELIKGVPLTKYCDDAKLTMQQRLELFIPVCQAVQHAHQKGVIHRDLKPGNILIGLYDGKPVPKVIDFGVAKATGSRLTDQTIYTEVGSLVGTLEYMSPEQAELNNLDIDTRSDIYALGVILYELLTGSVPFARKELAKAGLGEMLRVIKEVEPPKPSTKLSGSVKLPSIAANRHTEPAKLARSVKGDLDWIVMKALEKDRNRRYETANGFAADVMRYLAGETVLAHPPTWWYRYQKFSQRHRGAILATYMFLVGVVLFTGSLYSQVERAKAAERLAVEAKQAETERAEGERKAKEQATKRLAQIEKTNDILGSIFENLDPKEIAKNERPLQAILVEKLNKAVEQLEGESIGDPLVVAAMQAKLGLSLLGLGDPGKAIVLFEKARATRQNQHGPDHPDTLDSMANLALAYLAARKLELALPLLETTLKVMKTKLGPEHPDTLTSMNNLAMAYRAAGKFELALPLLEETLKLRKANQGHQHHLTLTAMGNLAATYRDAGRNDLALPLLEETFKLRKATIGNEHPDTLTNMSSLALTYKAAGKWDLALPLYEETLSLRKATLGPNHPDTLRTMSDLAAAYSALKQFDKSIPLFEETWKRYVTKLGRDNSETLTIMLNLGRNYQDAGLLSRALPILEEVHRSAEKYPALRPGGLQLLKIYAQLGKTEQASALAKELLADARSQLPQDSPQLARQLASLCFELLQVKAFVEVEPLLRECLTIREKKLPDAWTAFNTKSMLGGALLGRKKYVEAEPLLLAGYEGMKLRFEKTPEANAARHVIQRRMSEALDRLIQLYTETNKPEEAKKWQTEKAKLNVGDAKKP